MTKVLVVDDEESIRESLRDFFEGEGSYDVLLAEDGYKALEIFKAESLDLVFMDVKMPGIDGIEVFRQMKQLKPEIKVVIMTGLPDEQTFDRALAVSEEVVEGFIPKPFKPDDLRKCLGIVMSGKHHAAFQLTPTQLEALANFAKAAMQTVSEALSKIVGKAVKITLEGMNAVPIGQISKPLEDPGISSVGLVTRFQGGISGTALFMVSQESALALIDLLGNLSPGTTKSFDDAGQSSLKSLGTVLVGCYLKAFSRQANMAAQPQAPDLIFNHRNSLIRSVTSEPSPSWQTEGEYPFAIETELRITGPGIDCWFCLIPSADSLKILLHSLGTLK
ncbi:MAG: response regulator [Elusimicrobia bacterium]|nr:response regulator [Elusimicrobiota bacterium]